MGGATLPAMSNSGSGNQGITATMPVVVVAEHFGADDERLARALMLSHLSAIYIHNQLPRLSALYDRRCQWHDLRWCIEQLRDEGFDQCFGCVESGVNGAG